MEFITASDEQKIAVQSFGATSDDPVLVIPGGPCRDAEYLGDLAGATGMRRLVVVHPRGTSATNGRSRGWWNDASDILAVADALGLETFDVLGHSAGTRLALAVAAQAPGRVRTLGLITPAAAWLTDAAHDGVAIAARRNDPAVDAALASLTGPDPTDEAEFQRRWEVEAPAGYGRWTDVERRHSAIGTMSLASASAWFQDIPADVNERILAAPLPPVLVIGGREDILSGVEPVRAYADALGAELHWIDDCGHYPWVEQPTAFRAALEPWISG